MNRTGNSPAPPPRPYTALFGWEHDSVGELPIAVHVLGTGPSEAVDASYATLRTHLAARTDVPTAVLMQQTSFITVLEGHCVPAPNEGIIINTNGSVSAMASTGADAASVSGARRIDVSYSRLYSVSALVPAHLDGADVTEWLEARHGWQADGELVDERVESWEDPEAGLDGRWQR